MNNSYNNLMRRPRTNKEIRSLLYSDGKGTYGLLDLMIKEKRQGKLEMGEFDDAEIKEITLSAELKKFSDSCACSARQKRRILPNAL